MPSKLLFHKDVAEALQRLAEADAKSYRIIRRKLEAFASTGRGNIKQVLPGLYRLAPTRKWRAYFGREGDKILVTDLVLRPRAYRHDAIERAMRRLERMRSL